MRISQRGVTLIELMITVAVLAVLLAVAVPSFADYFERTRLRAAADDVISLVQRARIESVSTGLPVNISTGGTASSWCVGALAASPGVLGTQLPTAVDACDCTVANECQVNAIELRVVGGTYGGVTVDAIEAADTFIVNARYGTLTDPDATPAIVLTSSAGKYQLQVDVSSLGHARSCVPGGKRSIPGIQSC